MQGLSIPAKGVIDRSRHLLLQVTTVFSPHNAVNCRPVQRVMAEKEAKKSFRPLSQGTHHVAAARAPTDSMTSGAKSYAAVVRSASQVAPALTLFVGERDHRFYVLTPECRLR